MLTFCKQSGYGFWIVACVVLMALAIYFFIWQGWLIVALITAVLSILCGTKSNALLMEEIENDVTGEKMEDEPNA